MWTGKPGEAVWVHDLDAALRTIYVNDFSGISGTHEVTANAVRSLPALRGGVSGGPGGPAGPPPP